MSRSCTSLRLRWHRGFLGIAGVPCTSKGRQFRDCASISQPSALQRKTGHEHKFYCICGLGATGKVPIGSSNSKIARANCSCSAAPPLRHCTALLFSTQVHPRSQVQLRAPWALPTRGSGDRKRSGPLNSLSFCPAVALVCGRGWAPQAREQGIYPFLKEYILLLVKGVSPTASSVVYHCSFYYLA